MIERMDPDDRQILHHISETLDAIAERMGVNHDAHSTETDPIELSETEDIYSLGERYGSTKHHINWMHIINIAFVTFITLVTVFPAVLSTYFGTTVYAAKSSNPSASISRGDLMISKITPVSKLKLNDILLLRNELTWSLEVRQLQDHSMSTDGAYTTITTESAAGAISRDSYRLKSSTRIHKITSVIPKGGYVSFFLTSIWTKILGGLFLLALNIIVVIRRERRKRLSEY